MMKKWGISLFDDSQTLDELRQEVEQADLMLRHSKGILNLYGACADVEFPPDTDEL